MDRVFLDANVLFSAAYREQNGLLRLWQLAEVELLTSTYAANEAAINLATEAQRKRLGELLAKTSIAAPGPDLTLLQDVTLPEKDVPIMLAAIGARASHLLSGDKRHFGPLFGKLVSGVLIQPPAAFLAMRTAVPDPRQPGDHESP